MVLFHTISYIQPYRSSINLFAGYRSCLTLSNYSKRYMHADNQQILHSESFVYWKSSLILYFWYLGSQCSSYLQGCFRSLKVLGKFDLFSSGAERNIIFKMSPCNLYCWVRFSRNDVWKVIVLRNKYTSMLFGDYYFIQYFANNFFAVSCLTFIIAYPLSLTTYIYNLRCKVFNLKTYPA